MLRCVRYPVSPPQGGYQEGCRRAGGNGRRPLRRRPRQRSQNPTIINFAENPDGIDGRTGAQISGGFNSVGEAQELATTLQIGALPISLKLISQTQVRDPRPRALHQGSKPRSSAWRWSSSSCSSTTASSA